MTALAVVIVAYDSAADLEGALPALLGQLRADDELVVVDNGPGEELDLPARAIHLRPGANLGFAGGAARGAEATTAPLLLFINPDAIPQPGCIEAMREAPAGWAAWQALVLQPDGRVNTSGNVAHWLGFGWAGTAPPPPAPAEVGFASGAALAVRRADWDAVGGFEASYFMYGEDLDLSLRLRLAGRKVGILPAARVEHAYSFAKGDYKWLHLERNRIWTVLTVYPWPLLLAVAPALVGVEIVVLLSAARGGWLRAKLRAQAQAVRAFPWDRRRRVQALRRVSSAEFAAGLSARLDSPFLAVADAPQRVQRAYWRLVLRALR